MDIEEIIGTEMTEKNYEAVYDALYPKKKMKPNKVHAITGINFHDASEILRNLRKHGDISGDADKGYCKKKRKAKV